MKKFLGILFSSILFFSSYVNGQSLMVEQISNETYKVDITTPLAESKLTWNNVPDTWAHAHKLDLHSSDETLMIASAHPILKLKAKGAKEYFAAPRLLTLRGAVNFRDMGGYITKENREVKWGKLFRSADISKLTDDDLLKLGTLNIKVVCDLRGPAEVSAAPDRVPAGAVSLNLPAGSENTGAAGSFIKYMKNPVSADSIMRSVYVRNDFYKAKYKPMFDQLLALEEDKSLLFHCTAGKDRTGMGAALILYALGVDEAGIMKDYELTNEYRKEANEKMIATLTAQGIPEQAARHMMAADRAYLQSCFDSLTKNYGSVDKFLETEIGVTAEKKATLKKKFLY